MNDGYLVLNPMRRLQFAGKPLVSVNYDISLAKCFFKPTLDE